MDLVCGYDAMGSGAVYMGSISNVFKKARSSIKQTQQQSAGAITKVKGTALALAIDSRTKYDLESKYGVSVLKTVQWAEGRGIDVTINNLPTMMSQFASFKKTMARSSTAGTGMNQGIADRDTYFRGLGWANYKEYASTLRDGFKKGPYSKADYLRWVEGQKSIQMQMDQARQENQRKLAEGQAQATNFKREQALRKIGLTTPKSILPIAIAGVGAILLFK